jgi:hypothetical protein
MVTELGNEEGHSTTWALVWLMVGKLGVDEKLGKKGIM